MIRLRKKRLQTGLDIGTSYVKMIQLSGGDDNPVLAAYDIIRVTDKTEEEFKRVLIRLSQRAAFKEVNISVSGPAVVVRYVELPRMSAEELKSSMAFEAEKYIPFSMKEVILDCQIIEQLSHNKMRVLLAAVKKDAVSSRIKLLEGAGLQAQLIDCDSFALVNAFLLNFPDLKNEASTALLNLGARLTTVEILKGKAPYFTRGLQIGGSDFLRAVSERLNVDAGSAFKLIMEPKERMRELIEVIKPTIAQLGEEIKLSLNYYEDQTGLTVDTIYLSGGLVNFNGMSNIFGEILGIECRAWDPLKAVKVEEGLPLDKLERAKNQLHIALGLAIRG